MTTEFEKCGLSVEPGKAPRSRQKPIHRVFQCPRAIIVTDEPETEIGRRLTDRAAAPARIADEIREVGPMPPLGNADRATGEEGRDRAGGRDGTVGEAGIGPLPNIAGEIKEAMLVRAETADRPRRLVEILIAARFPLISRQFAL